MFVLIKPYGKINDSPFPYVIPILHFQIKFIEYSTSKYMLSLVLSCDAL